MAYLDCGTPTCTDFGLALTGAAKTAGVHFESISSGISASGLSAAFGTVVSKKPAAVIVPGLDPSTWGTKSISSLKAAHIAVVGVGYMDAARYGLNKYPNVVVSGPVQAKLESALQAAFILVHDGPHSKVVYVSQPDIGFSALETGAFVKDLKSLCPGCTESTLPVPSTDDGSTAPSVIVSYLQAHTGYTVLTSVDGEVFDGITPALRQAGIKIPVITNSGDPENIQDLKAGNEQANVEVDIPVVSWTAMDAALRATENQSYAGGEAGGLPPVEVLQPKDVTFNPKNPWTGYPNFPARFAKLWHK